ncbi:unnamed protein product [Linum trigynum]|uniref:Uncharacterized protein n=1 Tax=Linum trigynum TaxID=586398 RepID=A0AAV2EP20_9ROSI
MGGEDEEAEDEEAEAIPHAQTEQGGNQTQPEAEDMAHERAEQNLGKDHTCPRAVRMRVANATWVAKKYIERFRREPNWKVKNMMLELRETHNVIISRRQCYMARIYAKRMLGGSLIEEYNKLRRYVGALKERDRDVISDQHKVNIRCVFYVFF